MFNSFNIRFEVLTCATESMEGRYIFTIDNRYSHHNELDFYFSDFCDKHKSHNIMELDNG